ncbi:hypothetical protein ACS0TY_013086 [Phlomoides rotata]
MAGEVTTYDGEDENAAFKILWRCTAIRQQHAIVWKVLKQRIPTDDELRTRGIIPETQDICYPLCGVEDESIQHLFFGCSFSRKIWNEIYIWTGNVMVPHFEPKSHLIQHSMLLGCSKYEVYATAIWVAVVGGIWKIRNSVVFYGAKINIPKAVGEIKARTWSWLKVKSSKMQSSSFSKWSRNPKEVIIEVGKHRI